MKNEQIYIYKYKLFIKQIYGENICDKEQHFNKKCFLF